MKNYNLKKSKLSNVCVVKLKARREDVEVHLLLQKNSGAFSLTNFFQKVCHVASHKTGTLQD